MCHVSCLGFGARNLNESEIRGRRVLEVGACDINGGLRPLIESWHPAEYLGVDTKNGPGVDAVVPAEKLVEVLGQESFDVVVSTETLEHIQDWHRALANIKNVCRVDGIILITTRSRGFPPHLWPLDFWRFELDDMRIMFSDCTILTLEPDPQQPGVFIKVRKPEKFIETVLTNYELYSVLEQKRVRAVKNSGGLGFIAKALRSKFFRRPGF